MENPNKIAWKGLEYEFKPLTLGVLFEVYESASLLELGIGAVFAAQCKAMLKGSDVHAENVLQSGKFSQSILDEKEDLEGAFAVKGQIDFFIIEYKNRAEKLQNAAPDLREVIAKAQAKSDPKGQRSQKATKAEQEPSS